MVVSIRNLLFQGSIFRGYVSFREGYILNFTPIWARFSPNLTFAYFSDGLVQPPSSNFIHLCFCNISLTFLADSQEDIHESGTKGTGKKREETSVDKGMLLHILQLGQYEQVVFLQKLAFQFSPLSSNFYLSNRMNPVLAFLLSLTIKYLIIFIQIPLLLTTYVDSYSWLFRVYSGMKSYPVMWWLWQTIIRIPLKQPIYIYIYMKSKIFFGASFGRKLPKMVAVSCLTPTRSPLKGDIPTALVQFQGCWQPCRRWC